MPEAGGRAWLDDDSPPDSHIEPPLPLGIPRRRTISGNMCHGHPHYHSCSHTSLKWLYCPEAVFDLETGYEAPCANPIYSSPQPTSSDCPLQHCHFKTLRGNDWTCCQCGNNTNTKGWCTGMSNAIGNDGGVWTEPQGMEPQEWHTCGHGCCNNCSRNVSSRAASPEVQFEVRKGKGSRKSGHSTARSSHKRGPAMDYSGEYSISPEDMEYATSSAGELVSSMVSASSDPHSAKKSKSSSSKKKSQRRGY